MSSKGFWWGDIPQPKVCPGGGRWPPPKQVGPGTYNLFKLAKYCSLVGSKLSKIDLFHVIFCNFSLSNGLQRGLVVEFSTSQGLPRWGKVASTQASGTFNLSKLANYWSLLSSKSSKSNLFYAIFCQFSLCNGLQSGLVGKSRATQGLIRCGQVATTHAGVTWHLKPAQKDHILLPTKLKIEQI